MLALFALAFGGVGIAAAADLALEKPEEDAEVGDAITLKGSAPERTIVKYEIEWFGTEASGANGSGKLTTGQIAAVKGDFEHGPVDLAQELKTLADGGAKVQGFVIHCKVVGGEQNIEPIKRRVYRQGFKPAPLVITAPDPATQITDGVVRLRGTAKPGSNVSYRVAWTGGGQNGVAAEGVLATKADGSFGDDIELKPLPPEVREAQYKLDCWLEGARAGAQSKNINVVPVVADVPLHLVSPLDRQQVGEEFVIRGEAEPGSQVQCEVWWMGKGREGEEGRFFTETVPCGDDGGFEVPVEVRPPETGAIEFISGLRVRLLQVGKEPLERHLVYRWRMPDKPPPEDPDRPGERLPERFHARILELRLPKALFCEHEGREIEIAVDQPGTQFTWYDRELDPRQLRPEFIIEVSLREPGTPNFGVARHIALIEPRPEEPPPPEDDHGLPPPPPGSRINDGRVMEVSVGQGLLIVMVRAGEGDRPATVFVDNKTKIHRGPRMVKLGDIHGGSLIDARRGSLKDDRWFASDITVK